MAALAPRGADAIMPVECPAPLGVASGPSRRSLAQVGSGGSSSPDKGRSLSTSPPPSRRVGSSQVEIHLPSRCSHWMTCVPTRQSLPLGSRCGPPSKTPFYVNHRVQFLNTPLIAYVEFT